jgi:hypothetical protein
LSSSGLLQFAENRLIKQLLLQGEILQPRRGAREDVPRRAVAEASAGAAESRGVASGE